MSTIDEVYGLKEEHLVEDACACTDLILSGRPGLLICRACGDRHNCQHEAPRALTVAERGALTSALGFDLGDSSCCDRCSGVLWGRHQHVLRPGHGEPHYLTCEDCAIDLNITRQLPLGVPLDKTHGLICADCKMGRRHEEGRRVAEAAGTNEPDHS